MTDAKDSFAAAHGVSAPLAGAVDELFATADAGMEDENTGALRTFEALLPTVSIPEAFHTLDRVLQYVPHPTSEAVAEIAVAYTDLGELEVQMVKKLLLADVSAKFKEFDGLPKADALRGEVEGFFEDTRPKGAIDLFERLAAIEIGKLSEQGKFIIEKHLQIKVDQLSVDPAAAAQLADRYYTVLDPIAAGIGDSDAFPAMEEKLFGKASYEVRLAIFADKLEGSLFGDTVDVIPFLERFGTTSEDFIGDGGVLRPATDFVKPRDGEDVPAHIPADRKPSLV